MTATWTAPRTWNVGELVTAALLNTHLRDNMEWLKAPAAVSASASTDISTTSTTLVDMTNMSGALTMVGTRLLVAFSGSVRSDSSRILVMGVRIDAVTTNFVHRDQPVTTQREANWFARVTGITPGSRTISIGWQTSAGTMFQDGTTNPRRYFAGEIH